MPRPIHINSSECPYHVTSRSHNKDHYPLPLPEIWGIFCEYLWLCHMKYNLSIHAFVLMPNHFHLIASTPLAHLSESMNYFMGQTSKEINKRAKRINQMHGCRYYRSLISRPLYAMHVYKYVYRNPVKANLCQSVESAEYSTLPMFLGSKPFELPLLAD